VARVTIAQHGLPWGSTEAPLVTVLQQRLKNVSQAARAVPLPALCVATALQGNATQLEGASWQDAQLEQRLHLAFAAAPKGREKAALLNTLGEHLYTVGKAPPVLRAHGLDGTKHVSEVIAIAELAFRAAVIEEPSAVFNNNLGAVLAEQRKNLEALPHFQAALLLQPAFTGAHSNLAETWMNIAREATHAKSRPLGADEEAVQHIVAHYGAAFQLNYSSPQLFINYGEALEAQNRTTEAREVYNAAVKAGLWADPWQRPWPTFDRTLSRSAWFDTAGLWFVPRLEKAHQTIRAEFEEVSRRMLLSVNPVMDIVNSGSWQEFNLYKRGRRNATSCALTPHTCELVDGVLEVTGTIAGELIAGEVEFLILAPGTHLKAHCGTTNRRLTLHLGVIVPSGAHLRVGNETRQWTEGRALAFDDSYEHEAWHTGTSPRVVLYMSFWHPQLWTKLSPQHLGPV